MGQIFDEKFFRGLVQEKQEKHPLASRILVNVLSSERQQSQFGALIRAASDISWVPSRNEAFGLVGLEALLFGMPVITSGVGGMQEYLRQDLNEMLFRHRIKRFNSKPFQTFDFLEEGEKFLTGINHCQNVYLGTGEQTREIVRRKTNPRSNKIINIKNNTFSASCFKLLDDPPFHFNSFVFGLDSSKELSQYNAWSKFTRVHRWMEQNPKEQEIFQWSCIATALSKLWNRKPDGSLVQYSSIYGW